MQGTYGESIFEDAYPQRSMYEDAYPPQEAPRGMQEPSPVQFLARASPQQSLYAPRSATVRYLSQPKTVALQEMVNGMVDRQSRVDQLIENAQHALGAVAAMNHPPVVAVSGPMETGPPSLAASATMSRPQQETNVENTTPSLVPVVTGFPSSLGQAWLQTVTIQGINGIQAMVLIVACAGFYYWRKLTSARQLSSARLPTAATKPTSEATALNEHYGSVPWQHLPGHAGLGMWVDEPEDEFWETS